MIDAHIHLFTRTDGLSRAWLMNDGGPDGRLQMLREGDWGPARIGAEFADVEVDAVVHVDATSGSDYLAETRWLAGLGETWPLLQGIVGRADLATPEGIVQITDQARETPLFRGVRDRSILKNGLDPEAVDPALGVLAERGLSWDLHCVWEQMDAALECARRHEDLKIMLVHCGFPQQRDDDYRRRWREAIGKLAGAPNIYCKLSGLGLRDHQWTVAGWRPWLEGCIEAFGADRCAFASNFPVDGLYASYPKIVEAVRTVISDLSTAERSKIFSETARAFYRLDGALGNT